MPNWLAIALLGIIEGITEFLPISSTGHLLIAEHWLPHQSDLFNVVIQCGAVLAVLPLFPNRCRQALYGWREPATRDFLFKVLLAFFITGVGGLILDKMKKLPEEFAPVAVALLVGGVFFLVVEFWVRGKKLADEVTWTMAIVVGFGQLVAAVFPGASRSGTTIIFSMILGLSRPAATEFSFLVGIPTMMCAGGLKIFKVIHHAPGGVNEDWGMVALGTVVSAIVSFLVVKWLLRFVQSHTFNGFGLYRIALGAAILFYFVV